MAAAAAFLLEIEFLNRLDRCSLVSTSSALIPAATHFSSRHLAHRRRVAKSTTQLPPARQMKSGDLVSFK